MSVIVWPSYSSIGSNLAGEEKKKKKKSGKPHPLITLDHTSQLSP
jgi:hypothetical protein